jgi:hypothetical protein
MTQTDARATPSMYGRLYYGLRLLLHKRRGLLCLSQVLRAYVMLGPLHSVILRYYQRCSRNTPLLVDASPLFPDLRVEDAIHRIEAVGYTHLGRVPEA